MHVIDGVEVLDVREAAAHVHRTPETVRRWVWSGRLPARRQGNRLLVALADLDRLVSGREHEPMTLAQWAASLPDGRGATAADLVLDERGLRE